MHLLLNYFLIKGEKNMNRKHFFLLIFVIILNLCSCIMSKNSYSHKSTNSVCNYTKNDSVLISMGYTLVDYMPTEQEKSNGIFSTEKAFIESMKNCPSNSSKSNEEIRIIVEQSYRELIDFLKLHKK